MVLYDHDGSRHEIADDEIELEADGSGFWVESDSEDSDEFYEFCDDEGDE